MKDHARQLVLEILGEIDGEQMFSHVLLQRTFDQNNLSDVDRRFVTHLVYGVLENKFLLDFYIRKLSTVRFGKLNRDVVNSLRMGIFQIEFMSRVPDSAAVNESVKLVERRYSGFVNGILRNFIRKRETLVLPDRKAHPVTHLSIQYSYPEWLVQRWIKDFGEPFAETLLAAGNEIPDLCIRTNTLKTSREALIERFQSAGIEAEAGWIPEALILKGVKNPSVQSLPGFKEGLFQIQDISSMCVGHVSKVKPGDFVVDVCAAPGGKSTHAAQLMNNKGTVISRDLYPHKLEKIKENVNRLGIGIVQTEVFNAEEFDHTMRRIADVVLVDAPCSGLGIVRRKPDIKYNKTPEDIESLTAIQKRILSTACEYVKPGGTLIYSTCTIGTAENGDIVKAFLEHHKDFSHWPILSDEGIQGTDESGNVQLLPNVNHTDGFFIARLKRDQ
jgi:16S rRNA (cytosine967-C5)-methyltransferase